MGAFYGETKSFILEKKKKLQKMITKPMKKEKKKRTRKLERLDNNTPIIFSYHLIIVKRKKNEI